MMMRLCCGNALRFVLAYSVLFIYGSISLAAVPFPSSPRSDALNNLAKLRLGQLNVKDKPEYANALADLASWLADRLLHPPFNGEEFKGKQVGPPENIDTLLEEIERYCVLPRRTEVDELNNQIANYRVFAEKMDERIQYVMKNTVKRLEKVNAARMLAIVARVPTDALAPSFLKMIRDPAITPDVKLYIFEGLGNLLAAVDPKDPTKGVIQDLEKLAEICKELDKIITMTYDLPKVAPNEPAFAEPARVIQFIRRAAIRSLAQAKYSVVRNRMREPAARPIWTLLRVARHDSSIVPAFTETEQIEAMIGIFQMRPDDLVNVDAVAYLMADALLELGIYHNDQKAQFQQNPRFKPAVAWKHYGYRLSEAMKQWKANCEKLPGGRGATAVKLVDAATTRFVTKLEQEGITAVPDAQPLVNWKSANKPKVAQVFSDDATTRFPVQ